MRWELSEEQVMFSEMLGGWVERVASPEAIRRWQEECDPSPYERALLEEGWLGVGLAEEVGGQGGGLLELALASERFGRAAVPSSAWMATVLALPSLAGVAGPDEFAALVQDASGPLDRAHRSLELVDGRLCGEVAWVLGADRASRLVVPVWTDHGPRLFHIAADALGVVVHAQKLLDKSRTVASVSFRDVVATEIATDAGPVLAEAALRAAVLAAADAVGAMDRMLTMAVDYAKSRRQFEVPIASFQAVKHAAATMLVATESSRSISYFAAASVDEHHDERERHVAATKAQIGGQALAVADSALTVHGAIGYTWEYDLQLFYKRAKLDATLFGPPNVWNERLASLLPLIDNDLGGSEIAAQSREKETSGL